MLKKDLTSFCRVLIVTLSIALSTVLVNSQTTSTSGRGVQLQKYLQDLPAKLSSQRIESTSTTSKPKRKKRIAQYTYKGSVNEVVSEGIDFGVTFWRLRESKKSDNEKVVERIVKLKESKEKKEQKVVAERISSETFFKEGDLVRLSLEVPTEGYIYIFDQEKYEDGTLSQAYLVFPSVRQAAEKKHHLFAGSIFFIPAEPDVLEIAQSLNKEKARSGEVFTILFSPKPIAEIQLVEDELKEVDEKDFERWKRSWKRNFFKVEQIGSGQTITTQEREAANRRTRLSNDSPLPQTVYRVSANNTEPFILEIPVKIETK